MLAEVFGQGLNNRVAVYIPGTRNVNQALDEGTIEQLRDRALRFLTELFGGATAMSAFGAWYDETDTLVPEKVTIVYSFTPELTSDKVQALHKFVLELKSELAQEAISVEINGTLYFV